MIADLPLFVEVRRKAIRMKTSITATVMFANDSIARVQFGARGGWKIVK